MVRYVEKDEGILKKVGGIAYRPEFLLDAVLLCDCLREPSCLRETVERTAYSWCEGSY